jgi:hypothetical protein
MSELMRVLNSRCNGSMTLCLDNELLLQRVCVVEDIVKRIWMCSAEWLSVASSRFWCQNRAVDRSGISILSIVHRFKVAHTIFKSEFGTLFPYHGP